MDLPELRSICFFVGSVTLDFSFPKMADEIVANNLRDEVKKRLIRELDMFFRKPINVYMFNQYINRRLGRTFEWLCTQTDVVREKELPAGLPVSIAELHFMYKQQLGYFHKRFFDPTNRNHDKSNLLCIRLRHQSHRILKIEATIGCLQFIRWAQRLHLLEYCLKHQKELIQARKKIRHSQSVLPISTDNSTRTRTFSDICEISGSRIQSSQTSCPMRFPIPAELLFGKKLTR